MRVTKRTGGDLDQLFSACAKKTRVDDNNNAEQDTVAQPKKNYSMAEEHLSFLMLSFLLLKNINLKIWKKKQM